MPKKYKKLLISLTLLIFVSVFFVIVNSIPVQAVGGLLGGSIIDSTIGVSNAIIVADPVLTSTETERGFMDKLIDATKWLKLEAGSQAFQSALRTMLNTLAYDSANYVASGLSGQQPAFETREFGDVIKDSMDAAAGDFIGRLGDAANMNLCQPSLDVMPKIQLGLYQYQRPEPKCTFSQLRNNWDNAIQSATFLRDFQNYFEPTSNDLGIALSIQSNFLEDINFKSSSIGKQLEIDQGWLGIKNPVSGKIETPTSLQRKMAESDIIKDEGVVKFTGDALIDALNIFLNQLAIQLMRNLLYGGLSKGGGGGGGVYDFQADTGSSGGIKAAKEKFRKIVQPKFNVRGDYNILAELTQCPDPNRAGPTNCVITDRFRQAIQDKKTVGQAMDEGLLNPEGIFGFSGKDLEPRYIDENYPYRSMLILRKFRILPVGWEVAANYINEYTGTDITNKQQYTLKDMVDCFDAEDNRPGVAEPWCADLVDPNWVLKAPLNYCARSGYGPETFGEPQMVNGQYVIARKDNYCADEQACIKENADGSCEVYGYCTEERRTWNFGSNSCNPLYNTCETFTADNGSSISYLKNTLDFCDASGAGCQSYALDYNYDDDDWTGTDTIHFNKDVENCDSRSEGCHAFYRIDKDKWIDNPPALNADIPEEYYNEWIPASAGMTRNNNNLIYEKMLPSYLESVCYENGWDEIENAPVICDTFARQCTQDEVGCELYTRVRDSFEIPAKAKTTDRCPAQCNGYDLYVQQATLFEDKKEQYLIPSNAQQCSAQAVGCDEFTNLDEVEKGGEGIEYYSQLKHCTTDGANSDTFYTWEGSDDAGYQLRAFTLQKSSDSEVPAVVDENSADGTCEEIFDKKSGQPEYNSDCRQFYSRNGIISYLLLSHTITFSTNCHPYRRTGATDSEGIYMAIPQEGRVCSAREVGCRKYVGNVGNNVMNILDDDFESAGDFSGWEIINRNNSNQSLDIANDSLKVNNHSLKVISSSPPVQTKKEISLSLKKGRTYVIEFLAKADINNTHLLVDIRQGTEDVSGSKISFGEGDVLLGTDWKLYKLNLKEFDREPNIGDEYLHFESRSINSFYLDYIILREVTDNYYLLKDSLNVPITCDQDWSGNPHPYYMAGTSGCYEYRDRDNNTHYLRQFSDICSESAVGCELMIDTQNSLKDLEGYVAGNARLGREVSGVATPADSFIYMVYDRSKQCGETVKACQLTGRERAGGHDNVYVKNDPDEYQRILCGSDDVGCTEYKNDNRTVTYFKDPQDNVCEYRQGYDGYWKWWEKKKKMCDTSNDKIIQHDTETKQCATDNDCVEVSCLIDDWDEECPTDKDGVPKTIGFGGRVEQPAQAYGGAGKVGLCPAVQSQCTEIIDPVSKFSVNLSSGGNVQLRANVLYRLANNKIGGSKIYITCNALLYELNISNRLDTGNNELSTRDSILFYSGENAVCNITGGTTGDKIELKKAIVNYQLANNLDRTSCNGQVDTAEGCILFNERAVGQGGIKKLIYNADATDNERGEETQQLPQCSDTNCDSNAVLKVSPDRVCNEWLACKSKVVTKDAQGEEESACYDIGICDGLDEGNQCSSWVSEAQENQTVKINDKPASYGVTKDLIANATGYTKVGFDNSPVDSPIDSTEGNFQFGEMEQVGDLAIVPNGSFEISGANGYPIGWEMDNWNSSKGRVIADPLEAEQLSIPYLVKGNRVIDGKKFLQLGSSYVFESETIEVNPNEEYILTVQINTANLSDGEAKIEVTGAEGTVELTQEARQSNAWMSYLKSFKTGDTGDITIKLSAEGAEGGAGIGSFYFDNIQIRPALAVRYKEDNELWLSSQSCRLFPKSDSMSCDYIGDEGTQQKGWYGYCLEYDDNRQDGISVNPNACLQWWPVDRVKADGIDEGVGYFGRLPAYYCTEAEGPYCVNFGDSPIKLIFNDNGSCKGDAITTCGADKGCGACIDIEGYLHVNSQTGKDNEENCKNTIESRPGFSLKANSKGKKKNCYAHWKSNNPIVTLSPDMNNIELPLVTNTKPEFSFNPIETIGLKKWYPSDACMFLNEQDMSFGPFNWDTTINIKLEIEKGKLEKICNSLVQTVTPMGQNKFWSSRTYEGSDYSTPTQGFKFETINAPFGAITPPFPANNPIDWIKVEDNIYWPLPLIKNKTENEIGAGENWESSSGEIRNIFAKSYGTWIWNRDSYQKVEGTEWNVPGHPDNNDGASQCDSGTLKNTDKIDNIRPNSANPVVSGYTEDWCYVLPKVENVKVNGIEDDDVTVIKNGFVNLTFNTKIDDNQEPLVAYIVNWGDGETTSVSGVEMRDRSNEKNPYSLYHLYDYYDLFKKMSENSDNSNISCGRSGQILQCTVTPTISIKDNWGWYNGGSSWNQKGSGTIFSGSIVVREE